MEKSASLDPYIAHPVRFQVAGRDDDIVSVGISNRR